MTSLRSVGYEDVRWEPQGVRSSSAAPAKYGIYHPVIPADIAELVLAVRLDGAMPPWEEAPIQGRQNP